MNIFFWRSFKQHDDFVRNITTQLIKNYPPELSHSKPDKKVEKKFYKTLNKIFTEANEYGKKNKPGIYGKARIGNKFMWALKDEGYNPVLIDNMTKDLLNELSSKNKT